MFLKNMAFMVYDMSVNDIVYWYPDEKSSIDLLDRVVSCIRGRLVVLKRVSLADKVVKAIEKDFPIMLINRVYEKVEEGKILIFNSRHCEIYYLEGYKHDIGIQCPSSKKLMIVIRDNERNVLLVCYIYPFDLALS